MWRSIGTMDIRLIDSLTVPFPCPTQCVQSPNRQGRIIVEYKDIAGCARNAFIDRQREVEPGTTRFDCNNANLTSGRPSDRFNALSEPFSSEVGSRHDYRERRSSGAELSDLHGTIPHNRRASSIFCL